uniref:mRNA n=1 Tax=Oulactis sp. TaxID=2093647 RepID=A0A4U8YU93_OULSP|nr:mRNA [Oulactis sp. MM-2018]
MKTWVTFAVLLCCLAVTSAFYYKRGDNCADKYPSGKCELFVRQDKCHTPDARENCGKTCESCGKACIDWSDKCSEKDVKEELCGDHAAAFMICARSCGLCVDQ